MILTLLIASLATLLLGVCIQYFNILLANRFKLLDIPSARRQHPVPTPVTGGVGLILTWFSGLTLFYYMAPGVLQDHWQSLTILTVGAVILVILGLVDDLKGLSPSWKLGVETLVAGFTLFFDPKLNSFCSHWTSTLDLAGLGATGLIIWPIVILWIIGITNAINLIDGLDGLAGGYSFLVLSSIAFLSYTFGPDPAQFALIFAGLFATSIISFLFFNFPHAKIFLGDNGSLPLGYLISTTSLLCHPNSKSWMVIVSIILMLGYPLLDMGLAVLRRYSAKQPIFKADRTHLHYRIQRLGLNKGQTLILLLSVGLLLQFTAIAMDHLSSGETESSFPIERTRQ